MKTTPRLSDEPNRRGFFEILWSEREGSRWRSHRKSTKCSERGAAEEALGRFLLARKKMVLLAPAVDVLLDAYMAEWSTPRGNDKSDKHSLRAPREAFGSWDPRAIMQDDIDAYIRDRGRGKYGNRPVGVTTAAREITALQAALNRTRKRIAGEPTFIFSKPTATVVRDVWMTEAQEQDVLSKVHLASRDVRLFIRMALAYGIRRGAALDLTYAQIDHRTGYIDFHRPGARVTRKRRAHVPMTAEIKAELEALRDEGREGYVFARSLNDDFRAFMAAIGYPWVTMHVLKHTCITLGRRAGVEIDTLSRLTATDRRTLETVYRHHDADELLGAIGKRRG